MHSLLLARALCKCNERFASRALALSSAANELTRLITRLSQIPSSFSVVSISTGQYASNNRFQSITKYCTRSKKEDLCEFQWIINIVWSGKN